MPKEVNPRIHVNERDYPIRDHHCDDPVKKKMVMKLARMIRSEERRVGKEC